MGIPMSFISFERATTHPSLLESTTTGRPFKSGLNSLSQETKKLLQSSKAMCVIKQYDTLSLSCPKTNILESVSE